MSEQVSAMDLMKYGVFCAVLIDDVDMLSHFLPLSSEYNNLLEVFRVDYRNLEELDDCMLSPVICGNGYHISAVRRIELFSFIEAQSCPTLYLCCLKSQPATLETLMSFILQSTQQDEALLLLQNMLRLICTLGNVECARVLLDGGVLADENILLTTVASYDPESRLQNPKAYLDLAEMIVTRKPFLESDIWHSFKKNPLCVSSGKANSTMTELLLSHGALVDYPSAGDSYKTPLLTAIESNSSANVKALLSAGCDVNLCSSTSSPLGTAVETCNLDIFITLLRARATTNIVTAPDDPKQLVIDPMTLAASKEYLVFLWLLLCYSGNVNTLNHFDKGSLLLTMTRRQNLTGVKLLLRYDADIDCENTLGTTPLWAAVNQKNKTLVKFFISLNADLEISSLEYNIYCPFTATVLALQRGYWEILHLLLQAGGKLDHRRIYNPERGARILFRAQPEVEQKLRNWVDSVKTLKFLCRCVIRNCIKARIDRKINHIGNFPTPLKNYILLKQECNM